MQGILKVRTLFWHGLIGLRPQFKKTRICIGEGARGPDGRALRLGRVMQQQEPKAEPDMIALLRRAAVCEKLGISSWTLGRWVRAGKFPRPIFLQVGSPAKWRASDVAAWIDKRQRSRRVRPAPRGRLKQFAGGGDDAA